MACFIISNSEDKQAHDPKKRRNMNNVACLIISDAEVHGPREINCDLSKCPHLLVGWTLGGPGTCFHDSAGIRMGKNGFKKMMMQVLKCITT